MKTLVFLLCCVLGMYAWYRVGSVPDAPSHAPKLVSVQQLAHNPAKYNGAYVMLLDAHVVSSDYCLERSFFTISDASGQIELSCISYQLRDTESSLDDAVFLFEVLFADDESCLILLREARYETAE
ncbi:MAG: hypothetical protein JNL02_04400 [Saprospiraceae bacterium]|nr:hypothetical protein [Saprospiraceae bacterium]